MKMRKVVSILLVAAMTIGMVTGCGSSSDKKTAKSDAKGKVYYLNFKPEADEQWQELAEKYTDETGVPVTVLTAASGEYEKTLKSEMAKTDAPTLFQVNGPVGLASWKDYCYDLKDSDIAKELDGRPVLRPAYLLQLLRSCAAHQKHQPRSQKKRGKAFHRPVLLSFCHFLFCFR